MSLHDMSVHVAGQTVVIIIRKSSTPRRPSLCRLHTGHMSTHMSGDMSTDCIWVIFTLRQRMRGDKMCVHAVGVVYISYTFNDAFPLSEGLNANVR